MNALIFDDMKVDHPEKYILTIYLGQEHLYISLYNPKKTGSYSIIELTEDENNDIFYILRTAILNNDFFTLPFRDVLIMNNNPSFTYIPNRFYKEKNEENYSRFIFSDQQGMTMSNTISAANCKVLFKFPEELYNLAENSFSDPEYLHYSKPMIAYYLKNSKNFQGRRMMINLKEKGFDVFCFSNKTFLLGNYIQCKNIKEAIYFILFTWKQLQFNQSDDFLYISGQASFCNVLIDKLSIYLQRIYRLDFPVANHFEGVETSRIPIELAMLSV